MTKSRLFFLVFLMLWLFSWELDTCNIYKFSRQNCLTFLSPGDLDQKAEAWYDLPRIFQAGWGGGWRFYEFKCSNFETFHTNFPAGKKFGVGVFFLFLFFPSGLFRRRQKKAASRRLKMVDLCEAEAKRGYNPKAYKKIRSVSHDS